MNIVDRGEIDGPLLVFGGVYSNLQAFEALKGLGFAPENMICTGDVVAYCADAEDCAQAVRRHGCAVLAGNCERQLAQDADDCGCGFEKNSACDRLSAGWYAHAQETLSDQSRDWMGQLPDRIVFTQSGRRFVVIHGGANNISRFIWPVDPAGVFRDEIDALKTQVGGFDSVLAGHCGIAFQRDIGAIKWVNAGAIGLPPHDGSTRTRFVIMDQGRAQIVKLDYDYRAARNSMEKAGLVQGYHRTLTTGFWPSQDVLPDIMRRP